MDMDQIEILVERLRAWGKLDATLIHPDTCNEIADEIERLRRGLETAWPFLHDGARVQVNAALAAKGEA